VVVKVEQELDQIVQAEMVDQVVEEHQAVEVEQEIHRQ
tara:strand:+ start:82 stop:195 length:114 start_codon:yes stop_codon:yes gene_type:complete